MNRRNVVVVLAGAGLPLLAGRRLTSAEAARPRSAGEIRAGVIAVDDSFAYGDVRRYGMKPAAPAEVNSAALQRCLNANAGGDNPVTIPRAERPYEVIGTIRAPAGTAIVLEEGASLHWVATEPTGTALLGTPCRPGIEVAGDGFRLTGKGSLIGPSGGVYVANEIGVLCIGESSSSPRTGLTISDGIRLAGWGSRAIAAQFTRGIVVSGIRIRNCGYAGMQFLSCRSGRIRGNDVAEIAPGSSGNAYGISCSHDSRDYGEDPNALENGRLATHHFCIDFDVGLNTVQDIPLWVGIDFHGAYDCRAHDNFVYNCRHGLLLQGSSGTAVDFAGEQNSVTNNTVTTRRKDGSPTTVVAVPRLGISVNGGRRVRHRHVSVRNNTIDGFGDERNKSSSIQHTFTSDVDISNNRILNWSGDGCYSAYSQGQISDNEFGAVADPVNTACIFVAIGGDLRISGNRYISDSRARAGYGLVINSPTDPPYLIEHNDFRSAAIRPYAGRAGSQLSAIQIIGGHP